MMAELFCLVFKPAEGGVALPEDSQSEKSRAVHEAAVSPGGEAGGIELLAKGFAVKVPELKSNPGEIFSFLQDHGKSPEEATSKVEQLISKPPRISEDVKPENTQPEIARARKLARKQAREGGLRET
jgi:hypothetical protein